MHHADDPRIRGKQLAEVLAVGWRATLVTGDLTATGHDGVTVIAVAPGNRRRLRRILVTAPRAIIRAWRLDADLYHLHDPELLPWAWLLLVKRRPVVYDIHEDYLTSLRQKKYLPGILRPLAARVAGAVECWAARLFYPIIAEKYYARRFPSALPVLNYPRLSLLACGPAFNPQANRVLYTGNLSLDRGALQLARLVRRRPDFTVCSVGHCPPALAAAMRLEAGDAASSLRLTGVGCYIPFKEIMAVYRSQDWLAGLALFPDTPHYREKELTKFFEYMAAGLPIVASDFPGWRKLIVNNGVGLCVDPEDPEAVGKALDWLREHPEAAFAMGRKGRELVQSMYNWEREGQKLIKFYQELCHRRAKNEV